MPKTARFSKKTENLKPFVKWVGGKRQLLSQLTDALPKKFGTYYELFVGGGALLFHLQPEKAVINDYNPHLINAYRVIKETPRKLIKSLRSHDSLYNSLISQMFTQEDYYYTVRGNTYESPIEQSARFIFLNKTCFNGLYRENKKGEFNASFGKHKNPTICDEETIMAVSEFLQDVDIFCEKHDSYFFEPKKGDFVYLDPPYHKTFNKYIKNGFSDGIYFNLAVLMLHYKERGVYCLMSNSDTPLIRETFRYFNIKEVMARRNVTSDGKGRGKVKELLISNYESNS